MKEYRTQNLYEASFLTCRGFNFTHKERKGTKITLVFPDSQELNQCVAEFYAGGSAKAKDLFNWYRDLKDYVFSD